jgi:hypothetical protein
MPPKKNASEVELKVRIPRELMERLNDYRHEAKMESRKDAVLDLLSKGLDLVEKKATT